MLCSLAYVRRLEGRDNEKTIYNYGSTMLFDAEWMCKIN